ncbi:Gfo/Idh/MocA family oxidoreductase [Octadecabacter sp.]|nr:Gfo/Idh/MocA family oxidoreductase [Octadecabacter sp.]
MTTKMGVALVGAGMIAKTHVAALSATSRDLQLVYVISRRPEKAVYLADLFDGDAPKFSSDVALISNDPNIAFTIVATPPSVRIELIRELATAGKHILLEKPIGRNTSEATEVVEICEKAGVKLGVLFQHRVRAPSIAARRYVDSGELGALGLVEINVPLWRDQSYYDELGRGTYERDGGGVMITNAIHSIDLALSLAGPVTQVRAMTATTPLHDMEAEDLATAGLKFANGASGVFIASTAMFPHRTEIIRLHFEKGSLRIDKDGLQIDWRNGDSEYEAACVPSSPDIPLQGGKYEWHQAVIEDFAAAIRDNRPPLVTGRNALLSHKLIEAIETSSKDGTPINL